MPEFQINQPVSTDTWVAQNWANQHIAINSTLTVNTAFNISGCAISFGPFGKIVVASNGHLTSTGTDFFSCGHPKGWRGIRVENGGMLTFSNGNRVEDAEIAIDIATNAPVVISGNYFNRNDVSINAFLVQANAFIVGNTFDCTSDTYRGQRSSVGVRVKKATLTLGVASANHVNMKNVFRNHVRAIEALPASTLSVYFVDVSCSSDVGLYAESSSVIFNNIPFDPATPPDYKNIFTDNRADILTVKSRLHLAWSDFSGCKTDNIRCLQNTNAEAIYIEFNTIRINNDNSATDSKTGIYVERSSGAPWGVRNQIKGNTIWIEEYDTAKRRSAIIAKGFPGTDDNMVIELNHVFAGAGGSNPNQFAGLISTFLEVEVNSASGFQLSLNKIKTSNIDAATHRNRWGIFVHTWQAPAHRNTLWRNEVLGNQDFDYGCCAFHFSNSGPLFICNNFSDNTLRGFHFRGDCACSTFSRNSIGEHKRSFSSNTGSTAGIKLDNNAAFGMAEIGPQPCMGNLFEQANYAPDWAAWNEANLLANRFTYTPAQAAQIPVPVNPQAGWFFPDPDCPIVGPANHCPTPYSNCGGEYGGILDEGEMATAGANQAFSPPSDVFDWQSRLDLLGKLLRFPELKAQYPAANNFFQSHAATSAGLFAQFSHALDEAMRIAPSYLSALDSTEGEILARIALMNDVGQGIHDADAVQQVSPEQLALRASLLQEIALLQSLRESILGAVDSARQSALALCAQQCAALPETEQYEANQKFLNWLSIKKASGLPYSESDYETLRQIVRQCPGISGITRHKAMNMLPKGDPYANESEDPEFPGCEGFRGTEERAAQQNGHDAATLTIAPNPATSSITVSFGAGFSGDVQITDLTGKAVLSLNSLAGQEQVVIPLEGLAQGVYMLTAASQAGARSTALFVVNK